MLCSQGNVLLHILTFQAPSSSTALAQYKADGQTVISTGSWVNSTSVVLKFNMSSKIADTLYPVVEVKPVSQAFNGSNLSTGTAVDYSGSGVVVGSVTISGLTDGTTYHWRARVSSLNGNSLWVSFGGNLETEADFGCDLSSPVVSLNAPINGAATNYMNITFSWSGTDYPTGSNSGIKEYTLQISADINFGVVNYSSTTQAEACGYLLPQGTYYWRVRAEDNASNYGPWSVVYQLLIDTTPPSVPILSAPLDGATTNQINITFSWQASDDSGFRGGSGINGYEIYISTTSDFSVWTSSGFTEALACDYQLPQGRYYWRVRAVDNALNYGLWSVVYQLLIDTTPPTIPVLSAPLDGATTNQMNITFSWGASDDSGSYGGSGVAGYKLQISSVPNFSFYDTIFVVGLSTTVSLVSQSTYYWRVCSVDNVGNTSSFSSAYYLHYDTTPPNVLRVIGYQTGWFNSEPGNFVDIDFEEGGPYGSSRLNELKYRVTNKPDGTGTEIVPYTLIVSSPYNQFSYKDNW